MTAPSSAGVVVTLAVGLAVTTLFIALFAIDLAVDAGWVR